MTHLMLDLETCGTRPGAVVLSAALVRFSDQAHTTLNLSIPDQTALGIEQDPDTLAWWHKQEAEHPGAWAAATTNPVPLRDALAHLAAWIAWAVPEGNALIWCHGATFDCPLLGELYRRAVIPCPWQWWNVRDTRTLYDLAGINPKDYAVPPPHVALNDAIGQTRAANASLAILARAHQPQGVRRYFHHPESGSVFFTDDGLHPAEKGGIDASHCEEIDGGQYIELQRRGVAA